MKVYVATVKQCKNNKLMLEGYRNKKTDDKWVKVYCSACIRDVGLPREYYVGSCIDIVYDVDEKVFKEK